MCTYRFMVIPPNRDDVNTPDARWPALVQGDANTLHLLTQLLCCGNLTDRPGAVHSPQCPHHTQPCAWLSGGRSCHVINPHSCHVISRVLDPRFLSQMSIRPTDRAPCTVHSVHTTHSPVLGSQAVGHATSLLPRQQFIKRGVLDPLERLAVAC